MNKWTLALLAGVFLSADPLRADMPRDPNTPRPNRYEPRIPMIKPPLPMKTMSLTIQGGGTGEFRLVLPGKLIKELQEGSVQTSWLSPERPQLAVTTLVAGVALSVAMASAGLCFCRSRRRMTLGVVVFLTGSLMVAAVGCPWRQTSDQPVPVKGLELTGDGHLQGWAKLDSSGTDQVEVAVDNETLKTFLQKNDLKLEMVP